MFEHQNRSARPARSLLATVALLAAAAIVPLSADAHGPAPIPSPSPAQVSGDVYHYGVHHYYASGNQLPTAALVPGRLEYPNVAFMDFIDDALGTGAAPEAGQRRAGAA